MRLLFRPRAGYGAVQAMARARFGPDADFYLLSPSDRAQLMDQLDPTGLGHIAIELPTEDGGSRQTLGWAPRVTPNADPLKYEIALLEAVEELKLPIETPGGPRSRRMRGEFRDDSLWAQGSRAEPVFAVPLEVTRAQLGGMWRAIRELNSAPYYYQLHVDKPPGATQFGYSEDSFNCVIAIERVLEAASVPTPFKFPRRGGIAVLEQEARPYFRSHIRATARQELELLACAAEFKRLFHSRPVPSASR